MNRVSSRGIRSRIWRLAGPLAALTLLVFAAPANAQQVTSQAVLDRVTIVEGQTRRFQISNLTSRPRYYVHASVAGAFSAEASDVTITTGNLRGQAQTITPDSDAPRAHRNTTYSTIVFEVTANSDSDGAGDETFGVRLCTTADCTAGTILGEWTVTITEPGADTTLNGTGATVTVPGGGAVSVMEDSRNRDSRDRRATFSIDVTTAPTTDIVVVAYTETGVRTGTASMGPFARINSALSRDYYPTGHSSHDAVRAEYLVGYWASGTTGSREFTVISTDNEDDTPGGTVSGTLKFRVLQGSASGSNNYTDGTAYNAAVYSGISIPDLPVQVTDDDEPTRVRVLPAATEDGEAMEGNSNDTAKFRVRLERALVAGESIAVPLRFLGATLGANFTVALDSAAANTGAVYADTPASTQRNSQGAVTFTGAGAREATLEVTAITDSDTVSHRLEVLVPETSDFLKPFYFVTEKDGVETLRGGACAARACDNTQPTNRSYFIDLNEAAAGITVVDDRAGWVTEGMQYDYEIRLSALPSSGSVVVTTTVSGDGSPAVSGGGTLTFTASDWDSPKTVTIATTSDSTDAADGEFTVTHDVTSAADSDYSSLADVTRVIGVVDDSPTLVGMSGAGVRDQGSGNNISEVMVEGDPTRVDRSLAISLGRALEADEYVRVPVYWRAEGHRTVEDVDCVLDDDDGDPNTHDITTIENDQNCDVTSSVRGARYSANVAWPPYHNDFELEVTGAGVSYAAFNRYSPLHVGYGYLEFRGAGAQTARFALKARAGFDDGDAHHERFFIGFQDNLTAEANSGGVMPIETNLGGGVRERRLGTKAWFGIEDDEAVPDAGPEAPHDWPLLPTGLQPGDRFRLLYVTNGETTANGDGDPGFTRYAAFVRSEINGNQLKNGGVDELKPHTDSFLPVISMDGKGNASITAKFESGVPGFSDDPIYWVGGGRVATGRADFEDGAWENEANPRYADGSAATVHTDGYWTGSEANGRAHPQGGNTHCSGDNRHLRVGSTNVNIGKLNDGTLTPLGPAVGASACSGAGLPPLATETLPLYALSGEAFTVTGPGAAIESTASAAEGGAVAFTVTIPSAAPSGGITVPYTLADGRGVSGDPAHIVATGASGGAGADYDNDAGSVTIAPGATTATISVPTTQDSTYEDDHYFTVTLGQPTGTNAPGVDATRDAAIGVITDAADKPTVQFDTASVNATEGDGASVTVTVTKTGTTLLPASVYWTTADGTGASGASHPGDYTADAGYLQFAPGETSSTITIDLVNDDTGENAETFKVQLSGALISDAVLGGNDEATVTLNDDDGGVSSDVLVSWANTDDSALGAAIVISEGTTHTVKVTLGAAPSADVAIPIGVRNVSSGAQAGDYSAPASVTIAGGSTSATFDFAATPDTALENNEAVELTLCPAATCPAGYTSGATPASFQFIIRDVGVVLDLSGLTDAVGVPDKTIAEGGSGTFTVALDTDPVADATLTFKAVAGNAATDVRSLGLAAASPLVAFDGDPDTAGNQNALTFTGGGSGNWQTPQTVTLRALRDGDADSDLYRFGVLNSASGGPYMSQVNTGVPTLLEVTDAVGVVIAPTEVSVAAGETVDYAVSLSSDPGGTVTVTPTSGDPGKATVTGEAVTFTSSNFGTAQQITVTGVGAGAATVTHAVTTGTAAYPTTLTGLPGVDVTVTAAADVDITLSASDGDSDGNAVEGAPDATGHRTVTLTLSRALSGAETVTVPLTVQGATVTTDYTFGLLPATQNGVTLVTSGGSNSAQNPAVRFAAGARTATLRFTPVDNGDRTQPAISIGAGTPTASGGVTLGDVTGAPLVFSIVDDETGAVVVPPDWALKPSGLGGGDTFRLIFVTSETRTAESTDIDDYNTWARGVVARGGHASLLPYGGLVTVVGSTLIVDARENTGMWDPSLNSGSGGHADGSTGDSDPGAKVYWLAAPPARKVADNYHEFYGSSGWDGGSDQSGRDTTEAGASRTNNLNVWSGSYTTGTRLWQGDPGSNIGLGGSTAAIGHATSSNVNSLYDSGASPRASSLPMFGMSPVFEVAAPELSFGSGGTFSVAEGGTATVTVSSSIAAPAAATVNYTVTGGTATGGADYEAPSGAFALTAGATSHSFTIDTTQDTLVEGDETITVRLDAGAGYTVGSPDTATVTITDDDTAVVPVLSVALPSVEGVSRNTAGQLVFAETGAGSTQVSFDVTLDPAPSANFTACVRVTESGGDRVAAGAEGVKAVTVPSTGTLTHTVAWTDTAADDRDSVVTVEAVAPGTAGCSAANGTYTVSTTEASDAALVRDDEATTVSLLSGDASMTEGDATDTAALEIWLGRQLHADEAVVVPFTFATTTGARLPGNATPDFAVTASGAGVALANANTATPSVTFTGHGTDTVRTARLTLTPVAGRDDGDTAREEITATLAPDSVLGSTSGTGTTVGGGAMRHGTDFARSLTLEDDEAPAAGLTFSVENLRLLENGSATYTVRLNQEPSASVSIFLGRTGADAVAATVSPSSMTLFPGTGTASSWNAPQTVTVTGADEPGAHRNRALAIRHTVTTTDSSFSGYTHDLPVEVGDAPEVEAWEGWVRAEGDRGDGATLSRPDTVSSTPGIWPRQDMVFGSRPQDYVIRLSNRPEPGGTVTVDVARGNADVQLGLTRTGPWHNSLTVTFGDGFAAGAAAPNMAACNNSHDHREGGEAHDGTAATSWECWRKVWVRRVGNGHQCTDITHTASGGGVRARTIETMRIHNPASVRGASACAFLTAASEPMAQNAPAVEVPTARVANLEVAKVDADSASASWDAVEHATGYEVAWDALDGGGQSIAGGLATGVAGTSETIAHHAPGAASLRVTVAPEYVDGDGDTQTLAGLAATATLDLGSTGAGDGDSTKDGGGDTDSVDSQTPNPPPAIPIGSCVSVPQWKTVKGYYDANANRSPDYGANWYRVLIAYQQDRTDKTLPDWVGQTAEPTAAYTAEEAENGEKVWRGWTPVREVLECLERTYGGTSTSSVIGGTPNTGQSGEVGTGNSGGAMERNRWNPETAPRGFEPDEMPDFAAGSCVSPQLRSDAVARANETWRGPAHVERWLRVAQTFSGGANDATVVTPAEASFNAATGQPGWLPVADALRCMEQQSLREALSR